MKIKNTESAQLCAEWPPVNVSQCDEIVEPDEQDHGLKDVVEQPVEVEVADAVQGHGHDQSDTGKSSNDNRRVCLLQSWAISVFFHFFNNKK